jgi:hypothetical protein
MQCVDRDLNQGSREVVVVVVVVIVAVITARPRLSIDSKTEKEASVSVAGIFTETRIICRSAKQELASK